MASRIAAAALCALVGFATSGCGGGLAEPPPCGGVTLLSYDAEAARPAALVSPAARELDCLADRHRARVCADMQWSSLPDGAPFASSPAEGVCWVVFQPRGRRCRQASLRELVDECDVPDLRAVVPWRGRCDDFDGALAGLISRARAGGAVSGETARALTLLGAVDLLELDPDARAALERRARDGEPPSLEPRASRT